MTTETTEIKTDERKVDRFMSVPDSHISYNHVTHNVGVRITQQQLEKVDECYRQHNPAYKPTRESEGLIDADGFDNWNYFYIPESMKRKAQTTRGKDRRWSNHTRQQDCYDYP